MSRHREESALQFIRLRRISVYDRSCMYPNRVGVSSCAGVYFSVFLYVIMPPRILVRSLKLSSSKVSALVREDCKCERIQCPLKRPIKF